MNKLLTVLTAFGLAVTPVTAEETRLISVAGPRPAANPATVNQATAAQTGAEGPLVPDQVAVPSYRSPAIEQAAAQYKAAPSEQTFGNLMETLRQVLALPVAHKLSPALLVKENPGLGEFKPATIEASGVRVWSLTRASDRGQVVLQWQDVQKTIVGTGRRARAVVTVQSKAVRLPLPPNVTLKEAGFTGKEGGRRLVLSGDLEDGSLWFMAYRPAEGNWVAVPEFFVSLPEFLKKNVCGKVGFRGGDLVFSVGRMVANDDGSGIKRWLPEAESANYKFLLRQTETGYTVIPNVPSVDAFAGVAQLMQTVAAGRPDKTLLADSRLAAIFKYLNLTGHPVDPSAHVVEMSLPPGKGNRFRLTGIGKDDLIFDVAKVKGAPLVKALFIAPPDPFLTETIRYFPTYQRLAQEAQGLPAAGSDEATAEGAAAATKGKKAP